MTEIIREVVRKPVIAKQDVEVQDPNIADPAYKRQILAGHPVPADLIDAYDLATSVPTEKAVRGPAVDKAQRVPERTK